MSEDRELPRYTCHKKVWALQIADIEFIEGGDGAALITPVEEGYAPFNVSREYMNKHEPAIGGFFVVYEDGYQSFSPGCAFEAGYTRD